MSAALEFLECPLLGAFTIRSTIRSDDRGSFTRAFCADDFARHGLCSTYVQSNISTNRLAGTVRGMHFQRSPHAEVKLVRCVRGAIFDVIVDIRPESPTFLRWHAAELSEDNGLMMYVPKGFAHGYQTLSDGATAYYLVSDAYAPHAEGGLRHDDPRLGIAWPLPVGPVSSKDAAWPLL